MAKTVSKSFNKPDETRNFRGHGKLELINLEQNLLVGHGTFEPGWKWSNDVKPIAETNSCEAEHLGYCVAGSMVVRMNDGSEMRIEQGQAFHIPPGHDAWVDGNETCRLIDFMGIKEYARSKRKAA